MSRNNNDVAMSYYGMEQTTKFGSSNINKWHFRPMWALASSTIDLRSSLSQGLLSSLASGLFCGIGTQTFKHEENEDAHKRSNLRQASS